MATIWIAPTSGSDAYDGTSATFVSGTTGPKKTWSAGIAAASSAGDMVNVRADDGVLTLPSVNIVTLTNHAGTDYVTDPGLVVQGVDVNGDPAIAELRHHDSATSQSFIDISSNSAYIVFRGLKVNWAAGATATTSKHFVQRTNSTGTHIRLEYCHFAYGNTRGGGALNDTTVSGSGNLGHIRYSFYEGLSTSDFINRVRGACQVEIEHSVFAVASITASGAGRFLDCQNADASTTDHRLYNCTFLVYGGANATPFTPWSSRDTNGPASGTATKHLHSNVYAFFPSASYNARYAIGDVTATDSSGYSRTMGYTLFVLPNSNAWDSSGPYQLPWDPDDSDSPEGTSYWATDVLTTSDPFNDKDTPWTWTDINGDGYSIDLPGDLRLTAYRTIALDGGPPGAIEDIIPAPVIDCSPTSWDYGNVDSTSFADKVFAVSNQGNLNLDVIDASIVGDTEFAITSGEAALEGSDLTPSESRNLTVTFTPGAVGSYSATLQFTSTDPNTPTLSVPLEGVGLLVEPDIDVAPTSLDYGNVFVGTSLARSVTVSNVGLDTLGVSGTAISGADASLFRINSGGGVQGVAPAGSYDISITFSPTSSGQKSATLTISSDDPDEPTVTVALTGNGANIAAAGPDQVCQFPPGGLTVGLAVTRRSRGSWLVFDRKIRNADKVTFYTKVSHTQDIAASDTVQLSKLIGMNVVMLENTSRLATVELTLDDSVLELLPGGCMLVAGVELQVATARNTSTENTATITYVGLGPFFETAPGAGGSGGARGAGELE